MAHMLAPTCLMRTCTHRMPLGLPSLLSLPADAPAASAPHSIVDDLRGMGFLRRLGLVAQADENVERLFLHADSLTEARFCAGLRLRLLAHSR